MATIIARNRPMTPDDLEVKRLYDEYKEMKILLDYIRGPNVQKILETMENYVPGLSRKAGVKRRSRI
jgi:hypothetical protein